jgi:hypothetical protein
MEIVEFVGDDVWSCDKLSNEPLGAEFDIHNIEIKVKTEVKKEVDFFADMMPDIEPITPQENLTNFGFPKSPGIGNESKLSAVKSSKNN